MLLHVLRLSVALVALITAVEAGQSELRRLVTLSRHGSRAPNEIVKRLCPANVDNLYAYKVPLEQLTEIGMKQLLTVGKHVRDIYVDKKQFLSPSLNGVNHSHFETYFRADAATRCAQSASVMGYGLYPDGSGPEGFPHQPVPVTMQLLKNEHEFAAPKGPCRAALNADLALYANTRAKELFNKNQDVLDAVGEVCGVSINDIPTMTGGEDMVLGVKDIADMFIFDRDEGLPRTKGLTEETSFKLEQLAFQNLMERYYTTDRAITYWVGGFADLLLGNLNGAANPASPSIKEYRYFSYHGHRELLHGLGKMLGWNFHFKGLPQALNTTSLHPGTTMFFELHATPSSTGAGEVYTVQTYVWSPYTDREQVHLDKCSSPDCPLEEFNAIIHNHIGHTGTWEEICNYHPKLEVMQLSEDEDSTVTSSGYTIILSVGVVSIVVFTIYKAALNMKYFRRRGYTTL